MIHRMFTIYDQKAKAYLPPFVLPERGMAIRTFGDCCNASDHQFSKHPEDYTLFELALFDDENGSLDPYLAPEVLHNGLELTAAAVDGKLQQLQVAGAS